MVAAMIGNGKGWKGRARSGSDRIGRWLGGWFRMVTMVGNSVGGLRRKWI